MKNLLLAGIVLVSSFAFGTTTITTISLDEAQKVATEALKEAKAQKVDTTIVILNKVGNVIVMLRDDNAKPHTLDTAEKKAFTALTFEAPTSVVSGIIKDVPKLKEIDKIVSLGGGVPLVVDGKTVGSIGVAGAPSAEMDEQIANKGASVFK